MKRHLFLSGLLAALLGVCGSGSSKPEVPSWFKGNNSKAKESKPASKATMQTALNDLSSRATLLDSKMKALDKALEDVRTQKKAHIAQLRQKGVKSSQDLKIPEIRDDKQVAKLVDKLEKDHAEEAKYVQLKADYEDLHDKATDTLARLKRKVALEQAGISDKELDDIDVFLRKADARLNNNETTTVAPISAGDILDKANDK